MTTATGFRRHICAIAWVVIAASLCAGVATAQQTIDGVTADGALYRFLVPSSWNGQLVVYAHGYVPAGDPIALPNSPIELAAFQAITSQGFAVAMSSYAENGWAVKNGAQTTHQLRGLFASRVSKPTKTYLVGTSEGGLIALDLTESFPGQYDGTLSICGVVGGTPLTYQHNGDGRVLFDYFFPGVLPGDLLHMPNLDFSPGSPTYDAVLNALIAGLFAPGQPTLQFANVAALPGSNVNEIIFSGLTLVGAYPGFNELLQRTNGHNFYDNTKTVYSGSANDAALNAGVRRYSADPAGVNYVAKYYDPNGQLHIPTLTLHTTQDPTIAFSQEAHYAGVVAGANASNFLVQQSVNRYGHCNFKPEEILNSFQGLFLWVNYGVIPPSGDVTVP
jgi:pimeloyl-ACP methyl ester carboxylesterase